MLIIISKQLFPLIFFFFFFLIEWNVFCQAVLPGLAYQGHAGNMAGPTCYSVPFLRKLPILENKGMKFFQYIIALIDEGYRQGELRPTLEVKERLRLHL